MKMKMEILTYDECLEHARLTPKTYAQYQKMFTPESLAELTGKEYSGIAGIEDSTITNGGQHERRTA